MKSQGGPHLQKRPLSEPYSIPYRCLYSSGIANLMFAGRNISASHIAFASARVMGTIGVMGQAVGTAAALAVEKGVDPRGIYEDKTLLNELQKRLMDDDCFLPGFRRELSPLARAATLVADYGDASDIANGVDRRIWGRDNGYFGKTGKAVSWLFDKPTRVNGFRLVCDSDLDHTRRPRVSCADLPSRRFPYCLTRATPASPNRLHQRHTRASSTSIGSLRSPSSFHPIVFTSVTHAPHPRLSVVSAALPRFTKSRPLRHRVFKNTPVLFPCLSKSSSRCSPS